MKAIYILLLFIDNAAVDLNPGLDDVDDLHGSMHIPAAVHILAELLPIVVELASCIHHGEVDEGVANVAPMPAHHQPQFP